MATDVTLKKVRLSVSNAVHSLAVLVADDEGLFRAQGLDAVYPGDERHRMWLEDVAVVRANGAVLFFSWNFALLTGRRV